MNTLGCLKAEKPIYNYPIHSHCNWEIILHLSGDAIITIAEKDYHIKEGDVMVIPPETLHKGVSDTPFSDISLQAKKLDFSDISVSFDTDNSIKLLMNLLHKVLLEKNHNYCDIADNLTKTICSYISIHTLSDKSYPFIEKFRNSIYENLSNANFSLSEEIKKFGYNNDYFRRCFKSVHKKSPKKYMLELRIEQAKEMLIHDSFISVKHVSESCGFNDSFYFCTCFKKKVGISPLQFRKNNIKRF